MPGFDIQKLDGEHIRRGAQFLKLEELRRGMAFAKPPGDDRTQFLEFRPIERVENAQHIQVGMFGVEFSGSRRSIQNHRYQIRSFTLSQLCHELIQNFFHWDNSLRQILPAVWKGWPRPPRVSRIVAIYHQLPLAPPPPEEPPPKPPKPPPPPPQPPPKPPPQLPPPRPPPRMEKSHKKGRNLKRMGANTISTRKRMKS